MAAKKKPELVKMNPDTIQSKAEIERMVKLISDKMKDPKIAKKAALIISDMINKKEGK